MTSDELEWFADPSDYQCVACGGSATALIGNMVVKGGERVGICDQCATLLLRHSMKVVRDIRQSVDTGEKTNV